MKLLKYFTRAAGALSLALTGASFTAQAEAPAELEAAPAPGPALWKLSDDDTTIYLFGTVHALTSDTNWYDTRIETAFNASTELVTEIDMDDQAAAAQLLLGAAMLENGQTLRGLMSDEDRTEYEAALTDLGLPHSALDTVEPWFAAINLSMLPLMQSGFDPQAGVDTVLSQAGGNKHKAALETIEDQVALFDGLPMATQLAYLDSTVGSIDQTVPTLQEMVKLWVVGDADGLADMMNADMDDPELYNRLLVDRNSNWVNWIETRLDQPGTVFVAVGAGHLAGAGSVQDQLTQRGYEIERVWQ